MMADVLLLYASVLLTTSTIPHWQLHSKVPYSSVLYHGRHTSDRSDIDGAIQHFWNTHTFHLANGIVRKVLTNGNVTTRLVETIGVDRHHNITFFSTFYEGKVLSSIDLNLDTVSDHNVIHRRRKKQSFCLVLAYDGSRFCGWQRQPQNLKAPSVQEVIETTIERAFVENGRPDVRVSGRTDSGVHALGQIARVRILAQRRVNDSIVTVSPGDVLDVLNRAAQESNYNWRCLSVTAVSDKFHPTFDSKSRSYAYILDANAVTELIVAIQSTGAQSYTETAKHRLLVYFQHLLNSLLNCLVGKELDYYALSYGIVKTESTLCCLEHAKVIIGKAVQSQPSDQTILIFEFTGNRFLRRMVRILVGTCIYHALLRLANTTSLVHFELNHEPDNDTTMYDICTMRERTPFIKVAPPDGLIFIGANVTIR